MKIVLRKKDSVTSIILFIFNVYSEITGRYSIRLAELIKMMMNFDKNETAIRMGLSRMVKAGVLVNKTIQDDVYYQITEEGLAFIHTWNTGLKRFFNRYENRHKNWDERWFCINLLDFSKTEEENQWVVEELRELGMTEINSGTWIAPFDAKTEIEEILSKTKSTYLIIHGSIETNGDIKLLISDLYDMKLLRKKYDDFVQFAKETENKLDNLKVNVGGCLPALFELGWKYYDAAVIDPALPIQFFDEWEGDRAFSSFVKLRSLLIDGVKTYIKDL
ncbi:MAG: hypothetical protein ACOYVK_18100 [Bacillota bacterium]